MARYSLGPYPLDVPDLFEDISSRDNPPLHAVHLHVDELTITFTVVVGEGNDAMRDEIASVFEEGIAATRHVVEPCSVQGNAFVLHRFEDVTDPERLGATCELYLGFAFGDLIHIGFNFFPDDGELDIDGMRSLAMTMIAGAIARRGEALAHVTEN